MCGVIIVLYAYIRLLIVKFLVPVTNKFLVSIFSPFPSVGIRVLINIGSIGATPNSGIP